MNRYRLVAVGLFCSRDFFEFEMMLYKAMSLYNFHTFAISSLFLVDGGFSDWSTWSECDTETCDRQRSRSCNDPMPQFGGADCVGDRSEDDPCPDCGEFL